MHTKLIRTKTQNDQSAQSKIFKNKRTAWIDTATTMPPHWWYSTGKLSSPAPKPAFTTRNTDAYHEEPASVKTTASLLTLFTINTKLLAVWYTEKHQLLLNKVYCTFYKGYFAKKANMVSIFVTNKFTIFA